MFHKIKLGNYRRCHVAITYDQKASILRILSTPEHWENRFNLKALLDKRRKWSTKFSGRAKIARSPDNTGFFLQDTETNASIFIRKDSEQLIAEDESGRRIFLSNSSFTDSDAGINTGTMEEHEHYSSSQPGSVLAPISGHFISVRFFKDGRKTLFLEKDALKANFDEPTERPSILTNFNRFMHVLPFNWSIAEELELSQLALLLSTKLIVARDLDIEPDLEAINELDPEKMKAHFLNSLTDEYIDPDTMPQQWRRMKPKKAIPITELQKDWRDTVQFSGHVIDTPKQFFVNATEEGFELAFSLEHKERILSLGKVWEKAQKQQILPAIVKPETPLRTLLAMLNNARTVENHRGDKWRFVLGRANDATLISGQTRNMARRFLGLTGDHVSAIGFNEKLCFLTMKETILEQTKQALDATHQVLEMIENGNRDVSRMNALIDQGADLRHVDPDAAEAGKTFANLMKEAGNETLLKALEERTGIHDLDITPSTLPTPVHA